MTRLRVCAAAEVPAEERERCAAVYGRSRYMLEPPFRGDPPHAHFWHELSGTAAQEDAAAVALLNGEEVRGLCTVRTPAWDAEHFGFVLGRIEHLVAAELEVEPVDRHHPVAAPEVLEDLRQARRLHHDGAVSAHR